MKRTNGACLALLAALLLPMAANAILITSVDRATFQAAVTTGTINSQDFDGLVVGTLVGTLGEVTYSASVGTPIVTDTFLTSTNPNGLGSTSTGFFLPFETATFSFTNAITAFAIDINTFANTDGAYSGLLSIGDIATSILEAFPNQTTGQFLGFVSDTPFSSITISANTNFSYTLDTLIYGDAAAVNTVPEPATLSLLGLGLLGIGKARLRRKV